MMPSFVLTCKLHQGARHGMALQSELQCFQYQAAYGSMSGGMRAQKSDACLCGIRASKRIINVLFSLDFHAIQCQRAGRGIDVWTGRAMPYRKATKAMMKGVAHCAAGHRMIGQPVRKSIRKREVCLRKKKMIPESRLFLPIRCRSPFG